MNQMHIWDGEFQDFPPNSRISDLYESDLWKKINLERARNFIKDDGQLNSKAYEGHDYPLKSTLIAGMLLNQTLNILDVGGGYGKNALEILATINLQDTKLKYYILENRELIEFYSANLNLPAEIIFIENIENIRNEIQILHFGSVVQYFENHLNDVVNILKRIKPKFAVFSDLMAGDIQTYVTLQNYYGTKIPFRFCNLVEFIKKLEAENYSLLLKEDYIHEKTHLYFPQADMPERLQIRNSVNLVFLQND